MSRFISASIFTLSLALSGLAAPIAQAQTAPLHSNARLAAMPHAQHATVNTCFTSDIVPQDDSSMLTVCGASGPSKIIFAQ